MVRRWGFMAVLLGGLFMSGAVRADGLATVVHAVPGLVVDVYVNGDLTLEDFEPGTITDPLELPAGDYEIAIVAADGDPADPAISGVATIEDGAFASLVAHLSEDGTPTLTAFGIDDSFAGPGGSRVVVAHAAAAPAVDVELRKIFRKVGTLEGLENGASSAVETRAGLYFARIFPAGGDEAVFGPAKLLVRPGNVYVVYAFGSLGDETFGLLIDQQPLKEEVSTTGLVSVAHGVPGLVVDVFVNGDLTLDDFEPGTVTDPLELPAGDYSIAITAAEGGDPEDPILGADVTLEGGDNATIVAHLLEDGTPTISAFLNDLSELPFMRSRLVVRHLAAAPAVDIRLKRYFWNVAAIEDLANGEEAAAELRRGRYRATIFPAGSDDAVFGPVSLRLNASKVQIVYAIGSLEGESFGLLVQELQAEKPTGRSLLSGILAFFQFLF